MNKILKLEHIFHQYGNKKVLDNINFEVPHNEIVALLGPSGAGKSTLINIIGGLLKQTTGHVWINGQEVQQTGHVSYMPQTSSLMPWRTVKENIQLATEIGNNKSNDQSDALLAQAGFTEIQDAYPKSLSGGMKQRVSFLRTLNTQHDVLLLDEPFSALDEITRIEMQMWLKSLIKSTGKTVIMITHSINEAIELSDRIMILNGKPATITNIYDTSAYKNDAEKLTLRKTIFEQLK
ncbi:ABC transporter ATP-binding protein [Macrococcus capreoli]|uniref:ABC transporter ATP-binding protein n=1 Tax=Macrococcus capreoli TaxID=2982690 RepID=UPI0021D5C9C4|nr:ABC transporter ATP-binding protein [Macrococcus sp. TMW 2.2395]MCU7556495.1 ABC transporter ATP-binding protein [Macrococcus sp. TMW 2.2395]